MNRVPTRYRISMVAARWWRLGILATALAANGVQANPPNFQECLVGLQQQARERQVDADLVEEVIPGLQQQARVLELDRQQPEFMQTFGQYLARRVTKSRIDRGQDKLREQSNLLADLRQEYGIPGQYLVSFWGLETNYGGYLGNMPTLDSLATLACDERRSAFFTEEFLVALELMQREGLTADHMRGSWAGAMGHTQFMPSAYQQYAVDGDGDGQVDLWGSEADALTSGAHFLSELGWVPNLRWGREVRLPEDFDYALAGDGQWRALEDWAALGIERTNGAALPIAPVDALLLVPAGAEGPAFLVYRNFEVIMRWNRSESYALAVGLLADQIAGAPGLTVSPPEDDALRVSEVEALQQALSDRGFDPGPVDGIWGPATRQALSAYQASNGRVADGYPGSEVVAELLLRR